MQPLGRKPKTHNFTDCHPGKGFINWWEPSATENKRGERQKSKQEIKSEIDDYEPI